jgi:DNA-binding MarR family transcriptional regulator
MTAKVLIAQPEAPALGGVLEFMRTLWALDHKLQAASKGMLARFGVTGPQRLALRIIGRFPGLTAGRLAELLHLHPSTVTGILDRLDRQKLIRRWSDPRDGRRTLAGLTEEGRRLDAVQEGTVEDAARRALSRVSDEQLTAAQALFEALSRELEGC